MNQSMSERVEAVQQRIASACARAARPVDSVTLVAVSKTMPPEAVTEAAAAGLTVFGENRVQEAGMKIPLCPGHITWHLVGHLQRNKVAPAVELFDMIHSVDSLRLLETIDRLCDELGRRMKVLIEVNVAGEASKFGVSPDDVPALLSAADQFSRVEVRGLMTVPPVAEDPERVREYFRTLRALRDDCNAKQGLGMTELSMGMSHDFEVAIEEGATLVRVGTAIFGERKKYEQA